MRIHDRYLNALRHEFPHPSPAMAHYLVCVQRVGDTTAPDADVSDEVYFEAFTRSQEAFGNLSIGERRTCKRIGEQFIDL